MVSSTCPRYCLDEAGDQGWCFSSASIACSVQGISETERTSPRMNPCSCRRTVSGDHLDGVPHPDLLAESRRHEDDRLERRGRGVDRAEQRRGGPFSIRAWAVIRRSTTLPA